MGSTGRACCPTAHPHTRVLAYFESMWKGDCGRHVPHVLPTAHTHTRGLILSANDGIYMLFSTCSYTSHWVRFRFSGCLSLVVAHVRPTHRSPFRFLRTSLMPLQPGFVSASPLGSTSTAVCCAISTSNSSPPDVGRGKFLRILQLSWKLAATCTRQRPS